MNYYNEWVKFLHEHESMSLLLEEEPHEFTPINPDHFVIYANALVKSINITEHDIIIEGFGLGNNGSVRHMDPYNSITFAAVIN